MKIKRFQPCLKLVQFVVVEKLTVKVVTDKMRDEDESSAVEGDWKFAAMVSNPHHKQAKTKLVSL